MSTLKPPVSLADHILGKKNAAMVLVEFGDFECPHCRHAHPLLLRLVKDMEGRIQLVFRHFPLQEIHPHAQIAALAAEAAARQTRFWEMHDGIFDNQEKLNADLLFDLAKSLRLDLHQFGADWKSEDTETKVENDLESGIRSGVNGTPSFYLNGNPLLTYDGSYESLVDAIQLESEMKDH